MKFNCYVGLVELLATLVQIYIDLGSDQFFKNRHMVGLQCYDGYKIENENGSIITST